MQNFWELQYLADDLAEVDMGLKNEKNHFVTKHLYCLFVFFKKNCYRWLKLMTWNYTCKE